MTAVFSMSKAECDEELVQCVFVYRCVCVYVCVCV